MSCIFCKIRDGEIPKEFEYADENVLVFEDIHPLAPVHLLIVPRMHLEDFSDLKDENVSWAIMSALQKMVEKKDLMGKGYRVEVNGGGFQIVPHLHFHLIGPTKKPIRK